MFVTISRFLVRVSYLEIYNEEVRDLLSKNQNVHLEIKERPDVGVYVKDLSTYVVNNAEDMERIMSMGNKNRMFLHSQVVTVILIIIQNVNRVCGCYTDEHPQLSIARHIYGSCRVQ